MSLKTTRCIVCSVEFSEEQIRAATCCPTCKSKAVPLSISEDFMLEINWHELHVLCQLAYTHAKTIGPSSIQVVDAIIDRLHESRKEGWTALTLDRELAEVFPSQEPRKQCKIKLVEHND